MSKLKIKDGDQWTEIPAGGIGIPSGGMADQFLKKSSAVDYATEWSNLPDILTDKKLKVINLVSTATGQWAESIEQAFATVPDGWNFIGTIIHKTTNFIFLIGNRVDSNNGYALAFGVDSGTTSVNRFYAKKSGSWSF